MSYLIPYLKERSSPYSSVSIYAWQYQTKRNRGSRGLLCPLLQHGQKRSSRVITRGCGPRCLPWEAHLEQLGTVRRQAVAEKKTSQFIPVEN